MPRFRQTESSMKDDEQIRNHTHVVTPISGTMDAHRRSEPSHGTGARVAEIDVPLLHKGMTTYFTTPGYPGKRWSGKLRQVIPIPADGSG